MTDRQNVQLARAKRMAAELREHQEVRQAFKNVTAKLKACGEREEQPVNLRNGLAARVDAILSRKEEP